MSLPIEYSRQLLVTLGVEGILMLLTVFFLSEPGWAIRPRGASLRMSLWAGGLVFLCLTFCWSFILGCVIALHRMNAVG